MTEIGLSIASHSGLAPAKIGELARLAPAPEGPP